MEEVEAPTEAIEKIVHRHAFSAREKWFSHVALATSIFAVLAAISAMIGNHHANEAMIEEVHASDQWNYYQARAIKSYILGSKLELMNSLGVPAPAADKETLEKYMLEQDVISKQATDTGFHAIAHLEKYFVMSRGVTFFQIAIGVAAISVLSERKRFWWMSLVFALAGLLFFLQGVFLA